MVKTQKSEKVLPWQQLLLDAAQNLISSRSFNDEYVRKVWWKLAVINYSGISVESLAQQYQLLEIHLAHDI